MQTYTLFGQIHKSTHTLSMLCNDVLLVWDAKRYHNPVFREGSGLAFHERFTK